MIEGMGKPQKVVKQTPTVLDLSKIQNAELESFDTREVKQGSFEVKENETSIIKTSKKFNFSRTEIVPLPSRGILYKTDDENILQGKIKLRAMTVEDEKILSTKRYIQSGSAIRMVLENCIQSNINAEDLLVFDSNFLLFYLRSISHGDSYSFELTCDNSSCEKKFKHNINISKQKFEELPEGFVEPIVVNLPGSGYTTYMKLPRLRVTEELRRLESGRMKKTTDSDSTMTQSFVLNTIKIVDTEGNTVPRNDWQEFYDALPSIDSAEIRAKTRFDSGVDKLVDVVCPYCNMSAEYSMPITAEFFRF